MHEGSPLWIVDRPLPCRFGRISQIDSGTSLCNFEIPHLRSSTLILRGGQTAQAEIRLVIILLDSNCIMNSRPTAIWPLRVPSPNCLGCFRARAYLYEYKCFD